jgi:hypothetical protein
MSDKGTAQVVKTIQLSESTWKILSALRIANDLKTMEDVILRLLSRSITKGMIQKAEAL